jgi:hypothetical protein
MPSCKPESAAPSPRRMRTGAAWEGITTENAQHRTAIAGSRDGAAV